MATKLFDSENFTKIPLVALRCKTRCIISQMLNSTKIIPSPSGLPRDWRGLAHIANLSTSPAPNSCDPTEYIIENWSKTMTTFTDLIEAFKELDRWDILYDIFSYLESDADVYKKAKESGLKIVHKNEEIDKLILTVDDIQLAEKGMEPQIYDAFLLYSEADEKFANEIVNKLENDYKLKLCLKDRDLIGGISFEHEAIMRLISERCNRIIVIVSQSFLDSPANTFFVTYAQAVGIEQGRRKIIPCVYTKFRLPPQLCYYYVLDYTRRSQWWDFWQILSKSIISLPNVEYQRTKTDQKVIIKEINEVENQSPLKSIDQPEKWDCPNKSEISTKKIYDKDNILINKTEDNIKNQAQQSTSTNNTKSTTKLSILKNVLPNSTKEKTNKRTWFKKKKKKVAVTS